jgi:hypothetical protein
MDCPGVSERLPWLLNGSLSASEADEVRSHLATCERCREEWEETRGAASVFDAHVPTSVVMDLAWDRPPSGLDPGLARAHVESCADCREELELARASRRLEAQEASSPARRGPSVGFWLPAALAAGLVIGFGLGARRTVTPPPDDPRVATLEEESARLRALVASLEAAARSARPRINLPLFELLPRVVRRGGASDGTEVTIPDGAPEVALLLSVDSPPGAAATLAIADAAGREVWKAEGLVAGPPGGYVVTVPSEMLPDGAYVIRLKPSTGPAVEYPIRVRRQG